MSKVTVLNRDLDLSLANRLDPVVYLPKVTVANTAIVNRARCTDFANDLLPKFGVERVIMQGLQEVQGEYGPNGERVFKPINDVHDQVRMVGSWSSLNESNGLYLLTSTLNDYMEISFYGTGLNLLCIYMAARDWRVSIDGGPEVAIANSSHSAVLLSRNYSANSVINIASGLTLGLHIAKIRLVSGAGLNPCGYEALNTNSTLQMSPGALYLGGKRLYKAALSTDSYNSGFESGTLGTRGGHVLVYQKADGTVAKAVTPTDAAAAYLTSASHTNEEVVRTYHWREFGAGRADDFSSITTTASSRTFTLDDGTTTLFGLNLGNLTVNGLDCVRTLTAAGDFITLTFVGTGLDILVTQGTAGGSDVHTVSIDGGSALTYSSTGIASTRVIKIASGLPYGTHTAKFISPTVVTASMCFSQFIVYAPKTPTLPSGAVALSDYFVMADYSATTTYGSANVVSPGSLRKMLSREAVYSGTWTVAALDVNFASGLDIRTNTASSYVELTFVGTGIEYRPLISNATYNTTFQISIAGAALAAPTGSTFTYQGSGLTYSAATGLLSGTASGSATYAGGIWSLTGLVFGVHKLRITYNSGANLYTDAFNIITPIHAPKDIGVGDLQNTQNTGSCAIRDLRKFSGTAVKPLTNWAQAVGVASGPTTTSVSYIPCPDMSLTLKTSGNPVHITYSMTNYMTSIGSGPGATFAIIYVNGVAVSRDTLSGYTTSGIVGVNADSIILPLSAGVHKIDLYWKSNGGSNIAANSTTSRTLTAREL